MMVSKIYYGQKLEPGLWILLSYVFVLSPVLILYFYQPLWQGWTAKSIDNFFAITSPLILVKVFRKLARMRGSSVEVKEDALQITEWNGRRWVILSNEEITFDRKMTIVSILCLHLDAYNSFFDYMYRIKSGKNEVYVDFSSCSDPHQEAKALIKWLQQSGARVHS